MLAIADSGVPLLLAGFKAKSKLVTPERLLDIWTELINKHALLAAEVECDSVNEVRFSFDPPASNAEARAKAKSLMELRTEQDPKGEQDSAPTNFSD